MSGMLTRAAQAPLSSVGSVHKSVRATVVAHALLRAVSTLVSRLVLQPSWKAPVALLLVCLLAVPALPQAPAAQAPKPAPAEPAPPAPAPQAPPPPAARPPAQAPVVNLQNASLVEVIDILARRMKINYILDPRVKGTVTVNTYGEAKQVDARALLETILRINGAAMVQVGELYRIVPIAEVSRLPIPPQVDAKSFPEDQRIMLNLVFLKYTPVGELMKLLQPFLGEGAQMVIYEPANLLVLEDNARNMQRTMDLVALFDNDSLAGKRVRLFEVKNSRASALAVEMDAVMRAVSLSDKVGATKFLPIDRINTLVAIAPNPGVFDQITEWLRRLDIEPKVTAGTTENHVYRVRYGWADSLAGAIMALYLGIPFTGGMGGYGMGGFGGGMGGGMYGGGMGGGGMYGGGMGGGGMYGGGMGGGGMYGGGMYSGGGGMYGGGGGMYGGGMYGGGYGGGMYGGGMYGVPLITPYSAPAVTQPATAQAGPLGVGPSSGSAAGVDQTGAYLTPGSAAAAAAATRIPRVIPNPFDNTLLIQATAQDYQQILKLLDQLDVPPRQILIEVKIYEVNMQGTFSSGVQAYLQRRDAALPSGFPASRTLQAASTAGLVLTAGMLVGKSRELLAVLSATEMAKQAKLVSAPTLIATDSIPASMNVGDQVPTLAAMAVGSVQEAGNSLFTQSVSNVQTGVTLNFVARATPGGIITLKIQQDVSVPVAPDASAKIPSPSFQKRTLSTQVTVQDGDTIGIGGIIQETNTFSTSGIPLLHRIPGIGAAFGGKSLAKTRTELVVLITPRVIYDTNQITDATEELKSGFKKLRPMMKE